jgi:hypothetical protein
MEPKLWQPGMSLLNANGDINPSALGYEYTIQTTTQIRAQVVKQKFYKVPPAEYMPVVVGTGAWMEDIKTNLVYDAAGAFESGIMSVAQGPSQIAEVDVGTSPRTAKVITWAKGYKYATPEVQKALASNNWDVVSAKMEALKRNWDLGIQKVSFLGLRSAEATVPGLLTSPDVNSNLALITGYIKGLNATNFQALVAELVQTYYANSNYTTMPNMFVMPMTDFLGLGVAASADFPIVSKIEYLLKMFRETTGNANFQIKGLAYADKAINAGYVAPAGKNRYCLYNNELETLKMDIPVDFFLSPAGTANNFQWQGVGAGQFTGCIFYRPAEALYFDWA